MEGVDEVRGGNNGGELLPHLAQQHPSDPHGSSGRARLHRRREPLDRGPLFPGRGEVVGHERRCLAAGDSFTSLGVQRICDDAGVARSAFYKNFDDKTDLLLRLVEAATEELFDTARAWAAGSGGRASMIAVHCNSVRVWREHAPLLKAYLEVAARDQQVAAFWEDGMRSIVELMEARIAAGQAAGLVTDKVGAKALAEFIVYGFERRTGQHIASAPASADREFARELAEIGWILLYGPDRDEV